MTIHSTPAAGAMSDSDRLLLTQIIEQERVNNAPRIEADKYFERFSAEQILKQDKFDLDPEELKSGIVGDGGDGGVDAIYLFANKKLIREDTDLALFRSQSISIDLLIVQAKNKASFGETVITKLCDFTEQCLSLTSDVNGLVRTLFNHALISRVTRFCDLFLAAAANRPRVVISYYYCSLGDAVDPKVESRKDILVGKCQSCYSTATVNFYFIGAPKLLELFNKSPTKTLTLKTKESMPLSSFGRSYICLVPLRSFYEFISDDNGALRGHIFEANVRDYEGKVSVNKGIATTLAAVGKEEFWWLNNGITILSSKLTGGGKDIFVEDPLIVNDLQTSHEIFQHFQTATGNDARTILVRLIESNDPQSTDIIINATNSQTRIPPIWLHATEPLHRNIESALKVAGMYYDRRKNYHRLRGI
jgi:hypothetical protein